MDIFANGYQLASLDDINKLLVNDNTPQLNSNDDLNNFFEGFKICNNVSLKNSPMKETTYAAILGLRINNGVRIQIFISFINKIFMRSYKFNGINDFVWDSAWTEIGGVLSSALNNLYQGFSRLSIREAVI